MKIFVDTSAFYAMAIPEDANHHSISRSLNSLKSQDVELITHNYVLLETTSLLQKRHGFSTAHHFLSEKAPFFELIWVNESLHKEALSLWTKAQNRNLSLVDCTSFAVMKHARIHQALAFDPHFTQHGFQVIP